MLRGRSRAPHSKPQNYFFFEAFFAAFFAGFLAAFLVAIFTILPLSFHSIIATVKVTIL
jgi:hypothetical protein